MERREFLSNIFKISVIGGITVVMPSAFITDALAHAWENKDACLPYDFSVYDKDFAQRFDKKLGGREDFPDAIRSASQNRKVQNGNYKTNWGKAEGQNNIYEPQIYNHKINYNEVHTPVYDIINYRNVRVFGQFFNQTIGKTAIVRGWDGNFYVVHPSFRTVFTPKLVCYGLPVSDYVPKRCDLCGDTYVYQDFKPNSNSSKTIRLYDKWANGCPKSSNSYHDNVRTTPIPPCDASDDGIDIGCDY